MGTSAPAGGLDAGAPETGAEGPYRAYSRPLLAFVRRCAAERGLPEDQLGAEDVVNEAFEQMLLARGPISNPPAWLFTVARRIVARVHAEQGRAHGDPGDHLSRQGVSTQWTSLAPRAGTEDIIAARAVMNAIAALPGRQRTATYLRQVQGWSLAEIGDYLGCKPATAGVHVHRGTVVVSGHGNVQVGDAHVDIRFARIVGRHLHNRN
jgi:RNA polymerase sigma factor (sigma-70 family)